MRHSKRATLIGGLALLLALWACNLNAVAPKPTLTPEEPATTPAPAIPTSMPAVTPTPTENLAPTPLPAPTEIQPPTAAPTDASTQAAGEPPSGPGITIEPAVGEPGDVIIVNGTGWPPEEKVVLSWCAPNGPTGDPYWELKADANGAFNVGLKVPPANKWPGGSPKERDLFQLRATSESTEPYFYWANFTYIKRFVQPTKGSPVGPSATPTGTPGTPTPTATPTQ